MYFRASSRSPQVGGLPSPPESRLRGRGSIPCWMKRGVAVTALTSLRCRGQYKPNEKRDRGMNSRVVAALLVLTAVPPLRNAEKGSGGEVPLRHAEKGSGGEDTRGGVVHGLPPPHRARRHAERGVDPEHRWVREPRGRADRACGGGAVRGTGRRGLQLLAPLWLRPARRRPAQHAAGPGRP